VRAQAPKQITFAKTRVLDLLAEDLADTTQALIHARTGYWEAIIVYPKQPIPARFQWDLKTRRGWASRTRTYWQFCTLAAYHKPVPRLAAHALQLTEVLPIQPEQLWVSVLKQQKTEAPPLLRLTATEFSLGGKTLYLTDPVLWVSFGRQLCPIAYWE
jgi:hypothetical protein